MIQLNSRWLLDCNELWKKCPVAMTAMNRASSYANRNCFPHMTISFDDTFALLHQKINYPDPKSAVDANYQARSSLIYLQLTVKGKTIFRHFCCLIKKMMNADFVRATRKIFLFCKQIGNVKENFHVVVTWSHKKEEKKWKGVETTE